MKLPPFLRGRPDAPPEPRPTGSRSSGWLLVAALPLLLATLAAGAYSGVMPLLSRSPGGSTSGGRAAPPSVAISPTEAPAPSDSPSTTPTQSPEQAPVATPDQVAQALATPAVTVRSLQARRVAPVS